jgi:hypothetical protein
VTDEETPEVFFLCSRCRTPTPEADTTVLPGWNPGLGQVITNYRCSVCRDASLAELRSAMAAPEARASFCDFLSRRGYGKDAETIRAASPEQQEAWLLRLVDAVAAGALEFEP